jgi:hypothetical protein
LEDVTGLDTPFFVLVIAVDPVIVDDGTFVAVVVVEVVVGVVDAVCFIMTTGLDERDDDIDDDDDGVCNANTCKCGTFVCCND